MKKGTRISGQSPLVKKNRKNVTNWVKYFNGTKIINSAPSLMVFVWFLLTFRCLATTPCKHRLAALSLVVRETQENWQIWPSDHK